LAEELPTPNARKTCALAIWLIQVQRLPAPVLQPAASRIAYALSRGIDGELGKEGKKGSANDGLKVINCLLICLPFLTLLKKNRQYATFANIFPKSLFPHSNHFCLLFFGTS
jgi:hypothetical protein